MNNQLDIAIVGYGKMGKAVEKLALNHQHNVIVTIDNEEEWETRGEKLAHCDAAIEFTTPEAAPENIIKCFERNVPVVTGSTGWGHLLPEIVQLCNQNGQTLFYASNFSIGVNLFFELNKRLACMLANMKAYKPRITETHHTEKLDAPSGTAISLANEIIATRDGIRKWADADNNPSEDVLPVKSYRKENITGTHVVSYDSDIDSIEIKHTAHTRRGFAEGAILAAQWIQNKKGVFTMKDFLNL